MVNQMIRENFTNTGGGALVCVRTDENVEYACPTGATIDPNADPNVDDGHTITIRAADAMIDEEFIDRCIGFACIFPNNEFEGDNPDEDRFIGDRTILIGTNYEFHFEADEPAETVIWSSDQDDNGWEVMNGEGRYLNLTPVAMQEILHALGAPDGIHITNQTIVEGSVLGLESADWRDYGNNPETFWTDTETGAVTYIYTD